MVEMNDSQQISRQRQTKSQPAPLSNRMVGIGKRQRQRIAKNCRRIIESDFVLGKISLRFQLIPFKLEHVVGYGPKFGEWRVR